MLKTNVSQVRWASWRNDAVSYLAITKAFFLLCILLTDIIKQTYLTMFNKPQNI